LSTYASAYIYVAYYPTIAATVFHFPDLTTTEETISAANEATISGSI
jgi:hypothetical protein